MYKHKLEVLHIRWIDSNGCSSQCCITDEFDTTTISLVGFLLYRTEEHIVLTMEYIASAAGIPDVRQTMMIPLCNIVSEESLGFVKFKDRASFVDLTTCDEVSKKKRKKGKRKGKK